MKNTETARCSVLSRHAKQAGLPDNAYTGDTVSGDPDRDTVSGWIIYILVNGVVTSQTGTVRMGIQH